MGFVNILPTHFVPNVFSVLVYFQGRQVLKTYILGKYAVIVPSINGGYKMLLTKVVIHPCFPCCKQGF